MDISRLVICSTSFDEGGAARAARRWRDCLRIEAVSKPKKKFDIPRKLNVSISKILAPQWPDDILGSPSIEFFGSRVKLRKDLNHFFIHWTQAGFLSLGKLKRLSSNSIFCLHDEWFITDYGHYRPTNSRDRNTFFQRLVRAKKRRILNRAPLIICPSNWLANNVRRVTTSPIEVVPNPIPDVFFNSPLRKTARQELGIGDTDHCLLLISDSNFGNRRKGMDLARNVILELRKSFDDLIVLTVGAQTEGFFGTQVQVRNFGYIRNDELLAKIYSAANCTLIPSRIDNFPQTSTESQSCGTPVILFDSGGSRETILVEGLTGRAVAAFNLGRLEHAIRSTLSNSPILDQSQIRELARKNWSFEQIEEKFSIIIQRL